MGERPRDEGVWGATRDEGDVAAHSEDCEDAARVSGRQAGEVRA